MLASLSQHRLKTTQCARAFHDQQTQLTASSQRPLHPLLSRGVPLTTSARRRGREGETGGEQRGFSRGSKFELSYRTLLPCVWNVENRKWLNQRYLWIKQKSADQLMISATVGVARGARTSRGLMGSVIFFFKCKRGLFFRPDLNFEGGGALRTISLAPVLLKIMLKILA